LELHEQKSTTPAEFANLVTIRLRHANGYSSSLAGKPGSGDDFVEVVSGTVMHNEPRIVRIGRYWTEFVPEGYILFCRNPDQPGMIGRVGTIIGKANVNIRHMDVGPSERSPQTRESKRSNDTALMIISVDDPIPAWAIEEIKGTGDIFGVTLVKV
jgi:D-3-phosphoglycerate dehydrogenase / 2-oxoglutarate reductase